MTSLQNLLERVKAADEADVQALVRDFCKAFIDRDDYPDLAYLIVDALSDTRVAVGAALALVERLLPGWTAQCLFAESGNTVLLYKPTVPFTDAPRGDSGVLSLPTPALAILVALLQALIAQSNPEGGKEEGR